MDREKLKDCNFLAKRALAYKYLEKEECEKGLELLKEVVEERKNKVDMKNFIDASLKYASTFSKDKNWLKVLDIYRDIMMYDSVPNRLYKNMGLCLSALGYHKEAIEYFKLYVGLEPRDKEAYIFIGELALNELGDLPLSIEYYEKAVNMGVNNFGVYNSLGHAYSKLYRDSHKEEQINYFLKAVQLEPNNEIVVKNLAYVYGKFDEVQKADEMYGRMMMLKPSHSDLHSYGAYLVKHGRFREGFKFLRHRFYKEDISGAAFGSILNYPDKLWKIGDSIEDKDVLIHYEQGFGDSIMFIRFLKDIQDKCKSVKLILQKGLIGLFKDSGISIPILEKEEIGNISFDCIIPMMDLPLVTKLTKDTIPYAQGYLSVPDKKVEEYKKKYIKKNKKLKVGFAFEGSEASLETKRDIPVKEFYELMKAKDIDMYCFQVGDIYKQLEKIPDSYKFTKLGETFKDWEDTACAMKCMDLMITSDNGVMNLAGALGVKTFGVFNSMTEWRWIKTKGDDIAWYSSIKPFQCPSTDNWHAIMQEVTKETLKLANSR